MRPRLIWRSFWEKGCFGFWSWLVVFFVEQKRWGNWTCRFLEWKLYRLSFSKQHEGRWPTQAGGDMYATWWPLQQSGFGVRRELEGLIFGRKIKEGHGQFLIFQIGGVFGICLDKWLRHAQVLVVFSGSFFLDENFGVFWSHQSSFELKAWRSQIRSYTQRNDRKFEVVVSF